MDVEQADIYIASFDQAFLRLREHPIIGTSLEHLRNEYRRLSHGRHAIYYRIHPHEIEVVRILHQSMDAPQHLP